MNVIRALLSFFLALSKFYCAMNIKQSESWYLDVPIQNYNCSFLSVLRFHLNTGVNVFPVRVSTSLHQNCSEFIGDVNFFRVTVSRRVS